MLREEIDSHREDYARALDRVRGRVELGLRILCDQSGQGQHDRRTNPGVVGDRVGTAYLRGRAEEQRHARGRALAFHEELAPLATRATAQLLQAPSVLLAASYLVERDGVDPFRDVVARLQDANRDVTFVCTGPWPPYSFVSDGD